MAVGDLAREDGQPARGGECAHLAVGQLGAVEPRHDALHVAPEDESAAPGAFREPARDVPVAEEADVVVCGAGPAGITLDPATGALRRVFFK